MRDNNGSYTWINATRRAMQWQGLEHAGWAEERRGVDCGRLPALCIAGGLREEKANERTPWGRAQHSYHSGELLVPGGHRAMPVTRTRGSGSTARERGLPHPATLGSAWRPPKRALVEHAEVTHTRRCKVPAPPALPTPPTLSQRAWWKPTTSYSP